MDIQYVVIDTSDAYHTNVSKFEDKEKMLDAIQHKDLKEVEVWEVKKRVRLIQRPAIVMDDNDA